MTEHVYQFPDRRAVKGITIDGTKIAFGSDCEIRYILQAAPDDGLRLVVAVARMLLTMTERAAVAAGWADMATAQRRALYLLDLVIDEFPGKFGNPQCCAATQHCDTTQGDEKPRH